jgi:hypothetical protein
VSEVRRPQENHAHAVRLRIGTWNLEGRWSFEHQHLLAWQQSDVWLLTEVSEKIQLPGYSVSVSRARLSKGVRWAAVAVADRYQPARHSDPHPASVMATWSGIKFLASVLPWNSAGAAWPWPGESTADKTRAALVDLSTSLDAGMVWGGDWNCGLEGPDTGASKAARKLILDEVERLGLQVPTKVLPHRLPGLRSIDHIAVPGSWTVESVGRVPAFVEDQPLSDHDVYVVDAQVPDRALATETWSGSAGTNS